MTLSFMDAALGCVKSITTNPVISCKQCKGSGLKQNTKRSTCSRCGGSGTRVQHLGGGFQMASTCNTCGGSGSQIPRGGECPRCDGRGTLNEKKTVTVQIPAGVTDGMRVRVAGEGNVPSSSDLDPRMQATLEPGDLFVHIRIQPHPAFRRSGPNIFHTATIPMTTAALGGTIKIPTLEGSTDIKVPQGTTTGDTVTLAGQGIVDVQGRSNKGDYRIDFRVNMPKSLGPYERSLLEQLAAAMGDKTATRSTNDIPK
jgi:molecular chaperone DnaJ